MADKPPIFKSGPEVTAFDLLEKIEAIEALDPENLKIVQADPRKYFLSLYSLCLGVAKGSNVDVMLQMDQTNPAKKQ